MRRLAAAHKQLAAAWLTRGGLHGERREAESRRAMRLIGLDERRQFFFRLPDGRVLDFMDDIVERLELLFAELEPASVFVPAFEGGHPDHDGAQLAAFTALKRRERKGSRSRISAAAEDNGLTAKNAAGISAKSTAVLSPGRPVLYEFPLYNRAGTRTLNVGRFIPGTTPVE